MNSLAKYMAWPVGLFVAGALIVACSSVDDKPAPKPAAPAAPPPGAAKAETTKASKTKAVEVQGVISAVGQRTITFQMERKGKIREEVVGVDEKTKIEKGGANVKLRDLQAADQAMINYEPDAYTPAIAIKVTGKGKIQKVGGGD
jgi:multidrug efflux pump subunit AcrA (membrane-fusion protein)